MLEFFEVPSSANGAIGTADGGNNYDWYRADLKPGQLNLNLIIDDEVFAGLIDDPRLNDFLSMYPTPSYGASLPHVVTQIDANGYPARDGTGKIVGRYAISTLQSINPSAPTPYVGRGYTYRDANSGDYTGAPYNYQQFHGLKAAFSDFLKLRHGGSGYLFAHGGGDVGMGDFAYGFPVNTLTSPTQPIAAERPYRSLSYPDINYTIMRPASLPPSPANTTLNFNGTSPPLPPALGSLFEYTQVSGSPHVTLTPATNPYTATSHYIFDPGMRNPYLDIQFNNNDTQGDPTPSKRRLAPPYDTHPVTPPLAMPTPTPAPFPPTIPPTPARRLFQIPDQTPTKVPLPKVTSNASLRGQQDTTTNNYMVNEPVTTPTLWTANATLYPTAAAPPTLVYQTRPSFLADNYTPNPAGAQSLNNYLGAGVTGMPTDDLRQHPLYRTEWLQKISNLTTVRTHQFATWITVGFFEVVKTGTPELGIPDVLGQELGSSAGKNTRFRSFFVIDRTKATGFNPYYPGNFRDCVTYRRRIE